MDTISISTVTPVYNGAAYLGSLIERLDAYRSELDSKNCGLKLVESIFVVDDAVDDSEALLFSLEKEYDWVRVIVLSRNFGQHPATIAGILHSSGDWVITLDEDLQHKPEDITFLLEAAVQNKVDLVYAKSPENTHKSFVKDIASRLFKRVTSRLMDNKHVEDFNSFRLVRGSIARAASAICRHETYLDVAFSWFTKRVATADISLIDERNQNNESTSGYSVWGLVKHGKRMLMSSKIKLLRVGIPIGIFAFGLSSIVALYAIVRKVATFDTTVGKGWASTILAVLFFGGLSVLLIGLILEILSDVLMSINGKPTFFSIDRSNDHRLERAVKILKGEVEHL